MCNALATALIHPWIPKPAPKGDIVPTPPPEPKGDSPSRRSAGKSRAGAAPKPSKATIQVNISQEGNAGSFILLTLKL